MSDSSHIEVLPFIRPDAPREAATEDSQTAVEITRNLEDLPLALDQAGAFVEETRCSLRPSPDLNRQPSGELLEDEAPVRYAAIGEVAMTKCGTTHTHGSLSLPTGGTLNDTAIRELYKINRLITENYSEANIKQACYELRASQTYYEPPSAASCKSDDFILIRPRQTVVIIVMECIDLPNDIMARVLSKGQLFSIGLVPVNTYADPGFSGQLGIVMSNISNNYIKIKPGETIAKIEFSRLESPVSVPYKGQHGYQTKIWPIPVDKIVSEAEILQLRRNGRIGSVEDELRRSHGPEYADLYRKTFVFGRRLVLAVSLYTLATAALVALTVGEIYKSATANICLGVVASVIANLIFFRSTNRKG